MYIQKLARCTVDSKAAFDKTVADWFDNNDNIIAKQTQEIQNLEKMLRFEYDTAVYLACKLWSKKDSTNVYTYNSLSTEDRAAVNTVLVEAKRDVHVYNLV